MTQTNILLRDCCCFIYVLEYEHEALEDLRISEDCLFLFFFDLGSGNEVITVSIEGMSKAISLSSRKQGFAECPYDETIFRAFKEAVNHNLWCVFEVFHNIENHIMVFSYKENSFMDMRRRIAIEGVHEVISVFRR
ncbi:hypothetical protein AMATHDRAFT_10610 [Amanita thiersii Skay4041]|uniref:Uncharacterized protein n=1 Tax=Amanita thiersii Skay4041 TaxID=703135 RepID=A0A2A9N657_9AGAR|nr:hypothetical protein AMATHDRAFT_10610 [Amanita thiersii Skay4041]